MPDPWEYPWFAAWDLAFHAVTLAHIDPAFAKYQLLLLCREWFQHPNGALPAYEWSFDDVNPPVHASAALLRLGHRRPPRHRVPQADLPQAAAQLHVVAEPPGHGGQRPVLGRLPRARQPRAPSTGRTCRPARQLEQSDATAWMFAYCLSMLRIATVLSEHDPAYEDLMTTFLEHAVRIAGGDEPERPVGRGRTAFFYDALQAARRLGRPAQGPLDGRAAPAPAGRRRARARSSTAGRRSASGSPRFLDAMRRHRRARCAQGGFDHAATRAARASMLSVCCRRVQLERVLREMLAEDAFLSPHGLRALSRRHRDAAVQARARRADRDGRLRARRVDDRPVRRQLELARTGLVPGQLPVHRVAAAAGTTWLGDDVHGRVPDRLGQRLRLRDVAADLARRLVVDLAARRRRPPAGLRRDREVPDRPGVARPAASSTSTSTATPAPGSVPRTRPAGPASSPTCCAGAGCSTRRRPASDRTPSRARLDQPRPSVVAR